MSTGWSIFISVLVIGNLIGVMWLLFATSSKKGMSSTAEPESTGHEWDGISELNHPLPRWWFNLFVGTTIFAFVYMFLFPALGNYAGYLNWTQLTQLEEEISQNQASKAAFFTQFEDQSIDQLKTSNDAMAVASRLFANNCAACHGSDAKGSMGFPNLKDNDWLYGNSAEAVTHSISLGRMGVMPPFGSALSSADIESVSQYVLALGNASANSNPVSDGKQIFDVQCAACHGLSGEGNQLIGAPALNDATWLYGGQLKDIKTTITLGRNGNMPAHQSLLSAEEIRILTAYVLSL